MRKESSIYLYRLIFFNIAVLIVNTIVANSSINAALFYSKDSLEIRILPLKKDAAFNKKSPVKYRATVRNRYRADQEGFLEYTIRNESKVVVLKNILELKVGGGKTLESSFEIPFQNDGVFTVDFVVSLDNFRGELSGLFTYMGDPKKEKGLKTNPYEFTSTLENIKTISGHEDIPQNMDINQAEQEEESEHEEGEIIIVMKPKNPDGVFTDGNKIFYHVQLRNKYKSVQEGTLNYFLKNDKSEIIAEKSVPIKISKQGKLEFNIKVPTVTDPGIYGLTVALNLSSYDDTTKHAFAYNINRIKTPYHLPPDFENFWDRAKADLAAVPPEYKVILDESKTTKFHKIYKVEMKSLEGVTIFGWLTIPRLAKKFPVIVGFQGYRVELDPLIYDSYVGFNLNTRGIEKNWKSFNPENIQPLIINIEDPEKYVYRGIYMDCVRAIDFIYANADMGFDLERILVFGGSQGAALTLVTAALTGNKINTLIVDNAIFCDFHESYNLLSNELYNNFPVKHLVEYARDNPPVKVKDLLDNLCYYEVQNFMPMINASIIYAVSLLDPLAPAATVIAAYNKLKPSTIAKSEIYVAPHLGHEVTMEHRYYQLIWMSEKLVQKRRNIGR